MTTTAAGTARTAPAATGPPLRVTWVQPEDLLGHELRQAAEDGRDATGIARRWQAAGGPRPRTGRRLPRARRPVAAPARDDAPR